MNQYKKGVLLFCIAVTTAIQKYLYSNGFNDYNLIYIFFYQLKFKFMKKFLLSLAVLAFGANVMNAEVFNVNDATDFDGTLIEEVNTDKKAAKHYDPLNSLKLGGYTLTFTKNGGSSNPAYYWNMSTSQNTQNTIRLYKLNTLEISSEEAFGTIVFKLNSVKAITETNMVTATVGGLTVDASAMTLTWTNSEAVKSVKFTMPSEKVGKDNPQARIISLDITAETGDVPEGPGTDPTPTPEGDTFSLVETVVSGGQYNFVASNKAGKLITKAYGFMSTEDVTIADGSFKGDAVNAITFTAVDGKENTFTMKDSKGMYLGQDTEHKNTFQLEADMSNTAVCFEWTVTFNSDKKVIVTNTVTGRQVMQDPNYGSFGMYKDAEIKDTYVLPELFKLEGGSSVSEIEAVGDGEAVYYNLQGVKVAEPENGLYIKVQGNKATKVLIRK